MQQNFYNIIPIAFDGYDKLDPYELSDMDSNSFSDFELLVNDWPLDYFFDNSFAIIVDERLYSILSQKKISGVRFKKIIKISKGPNFVIYPDDTILPSFREMVIIGTPFQDDFGIYKLPIGGFFRDYVVASEKAVMLLVLNNCIELRGEIIEGDLNDYSVKYRQKSINTLDAILPRFEQKQFLRKWED